VFQTVIDKGRGNCMQAAMATLFDKNLDEVPNFIEYESFFSPMYKLITDNDCEYHGTLFNKNFSKLLHPIDDCFKKVKFSKNYALSKERLYREKGVGGYFYASVLSPKYFKWNDMVFHAVIIDRDFNIVHDPNPGNQNILSYPLSGFLKYNGIIDVFLINSK
jgi:hypothetical protein